MSPAPGTSTLTTWAPKSPSMVEQKGPARACDKSRILTSSSGSCMGGVSPLMLRLSRRRGGEGGYEFIGTQPAMNHRQQQLLHQESRESWVREGISLRRR